MPTHSDDRILWILVGLGLFIAAKAIPANLKYIRQLTQVRGEDVPPQRSNEDVERALKTETLQKLAAGRSYEIRSSAIKIIAERCFTGPALLLLLEDLASRDPDRRDKAIHALKLFVSHRSVRDSPKLFLITTGQAFHAMVTALVNLLPQHEEVSMSTASDDEGKVECYQMDHGLPIMAKDRFEAYMKRAKQMAGEYAERPEERAILCRIPAQQEQLLELTRLTPLTEYFFNNCAHQWFREDEISVVTMDSVPDIKDEFRRSLSKIYSSTEEMGELRGWRLQVSAAVRLRNVESLLKALWSCKSIAVQASSLGTAISTERDALMNTPGPDIYNAYCRERAAYLRQLTGGLFQNALQSSTKRAAVAGGMDSDKSENGNSKGNVLLSPVLPPSPIRPSSRPPQERTLLFILTKLLNIDNVEMALYTGLVSRWLYRYPFPCMLTASKQHDVVAFLRGKAWGSDDPVMAELIHVVTSVPHGLEQLREYGLTSITNFHGYWNGGDWYGADLAVRNQDVVMTGGEDTAGIIPSTGQSDQDHRPESSWSRNHPMDRHSEESQRRRRREAMVLSDGDGPLTEGNILQRENSRAALVPGGEPRIEEQLAQPWGLVDGEDEHEMAAFRDRVRQAARQREPLADITGLDH